MHFSISYKSLMNTFINPLQREPYCSVVHFFHLSPFFISPFFSYLPRYLDLRGLSKGTEPVTWPDQYGPAERDEAYTSFSLSGWGGGCGHDSPMIALDALLGAGSDWEELMSRAGFHGGNLYQLYQF